MAYSGRLLVVLGLLLLVVGQSTPVEGAPESVGARKLQQLLAPVTNAVVGEALLVSVRAPCCCKKRPSHIFDPNVWYHALCSSSHCLQKCAPLHSLTQSVVASTGGSLANTQNNNNNNNNNNDGNGGYGGSDNNNNNNNNGGNCGGLLTPVTGCGLLVNTQNNNNNNNNGRKLLSASA